MLSISTFKFTTYFDIDNLSVLWSSKGWQIVDHPLCWMTQEKSEVVLPHMHIQPLTQLCILGWQACIWHTVIHNSPDISAPFPRYSSSLLQPYKQLSHQVSLTFTLAPFMSIYSQIELPLPCIYFLLSNILSTLGSNSCLFHLKTCQNSLTRDLHGDAKTNT